MSQVQVLVAAMHQEDFSLPDKMNISTDAIIGNQCNRNSVEIIQFRNHEITYLNFNERGVGLNRNNTLMRATGQYCLFADDDMTYVNNYEEIVINEFEKNPNADVIIFNIEEKEITRYVIRKKQKVNIFNFGRYGAARIAIRLESIKRNAIYFNECFGGGTEHSAGEDNLFVLSCLKNGLKIIAIPVSIAKLTDERESTWFKGYNEKYIKDKGYLFRCMSRHFWWVMCLQDAFRHHKLYQLSVMRSLHLLFEGAHNE